LEVECPAEKKGKVIRSITTNEKKDSERTGTKKRNDFLSPLL
jgi:hypothetical protein